MTKIARPWILSSQRSLIAQRDRELHRAWTAGFFWGALLVGAVLTLMDWM